MWKASHFDAAALEAIREVVRRELRAVQGDHSGAAPAPLRNDDLALARGAIAAGSTDAPGCSTSATLLRAATSAYTTDAAATICNPTGSSIGDDVVYPVLRERSAGLWFALMGGGGGLSFKIGKLDAQLSPGTTGTLSVWQLSTGSTWEDSGDNVGVRDRFITTGQVIGTTQWVGALTWPDGNNEYVVMVAECTA